MENIAFSTALERGASFRDSQVTETLWDCRMTQSVRRLRRVTETSTPSSFNNCLIQNKTLKKKKKKKKKHTHTKHLHTQTHTQISKQSYLLSCFCSRSRRVSSWLRCCRLRLCSGVLRGGGEARLQLGTSWYWPPPRLSPQKLKMLDTPENAPGGRRWQVEEGTVSVCCN